MTIEGSKPTVYSVEEAVLEIYKATSTVYWPQYFTQWTLVLLKAGYDEAEVYPAIDLARTNIRQKSEAQKPVEKSDVIQLAELISRYQNDIGQIKSSFIQ